MPTAPSQPLTEAATVTVRISLPLSVYREFESRATDASTEVEVLLSRQLVSTRDQDLDKGRSIKISPTDRQAVESVMGRGFSTGHELAAYLSSVYSVRCGSVVVPLSPDLLKRLEGRRGRMDFAKFLIETVKTQLEHFVGLR